MTLLVSCFQEGRDQACTSRGEMMLIWQDESLSKPMAQSLLANFERTRPIRSCIGWPSSFLAWWTLFLLYSDICHFLFFVYFYFVFRASVAYVSVEAWWSCSWMGWRISSLGSIIVVKGWVLWEVVGKCIGNSTSYSSSIWRILSEKYKDCSCLTTKIKS